MEGSSIEVAVEALSMELTDPAILEVRGAVEQRFVYTRDDLLKLRESPFSQKKPEFLNTSYM